MSMDAVNDETGGEEQIGNDTLDGVEQRHKEDAAQGEQQGENQDDGSGDQEQDAGREEEGKEGDDTKQGSDDESSDKSEGETEYEPFTYPDTYEEDEAELKLMHEWGLKNEFTQEQMQEVVNLLTERDARASKYEEEREDQEAKDWVQQVKSDEEIGGHDFEINVALAKQALDTVGTPELKQVLVDTGWVNHPEFVRLFKRINPLVTQDSTDVQHDAGGNVELTVEERLLGKEQIEYMRARSS